MSLVEFFFNFLLGTKSEANDALFMLALTGVTGPLLAGMLTWKGAKLTMAFMGHATGGRQIAQGIAGGFKK